LPKITFIVGSLVQSLPKGNRVISSAPNKYRNNPLVDPVNATVHAEIAAIKAAGGKDLKGLTIYIARVAKNGKTAMARPCSNCMKVIVAEGIREIVYTNDIGGISEERIAL
jgi:deoxycytidylate deaminase